VSLIRKFWFYFSPIHFLISYTATTKEVVISGCQLWQSQRFSRHNAYAREVLFGRVSVSVFVWFAFVRLGSAPLGSVRAKDQAEIICMRRYGTAVYWNGTSYRGAISIACWNYSKVYGQGGGQEEGQASTTILPRDHPFACRSFSSSSTLQRLRHGLRYHFNTRPFRVFLYYNLCLILRAHRAERSRTEYLKKLPRWQIVNLLFSECWTPNWKKKLP